MCIIYSSRIFCAQKSSPQWILSVALHSASFRAVALQHSLAKYQHRHSGLWNNRIGWWPMPGRAHEGSPIPGQVREGQRCYGGRQAGGTKATTIIWFRSIQCFFGANIALRAWHSWIKSGRPWVDREVEEKWSSAGPESNQANQDRERRPKSELC